MRKLVLLMLLVVAGAVYAANFAKYTGTSEHTGSADTVANKRDSTDIWIGPSEGYSTILLKVDIEAGRKGGVLMTKRGFGLSDSALVRVITKGDNFPTSIVRSSAMALAIPKTVYHDTICNDTTFKGYIGIRVLTADTTSDSVISSVIYPVRYEAILK